MFKGNSLLWVIAIATLLWLPGCEHPPVKPTEDANRLHQIDAFLEELRLSYQEGVTGSFSSLYPEDHKEEIQHIISLMKSMAQPELDFMVDRIIIRGASIQVSLHWELRWRSTDSTPQKRRGNTLLHLRGDSQLYLQTIEGDNPFTAPEQFKASP